MFVLSSFFYLERIYGTYIYYCGWATSAIGCRQFAGNGLRLGGSYDIRLGLILAGLRN